MVEIETEWNKDILILHCYDWDTDRNFDLMVDTKTKELIEKPYDNNFAASLAYGRIYNILENGEPVPEKLTAC